MEILQMEHKKRWDEKVTTQSDAHTHIVEGNGDRPDAIYTIVTPPVW